MSNHYDVPSWAGKPPTGLHLDVLKEDKLVQKLMIDEKKCYLFGRNNQLNDVCIDHASCSRVHAAFVYHKHLNIAYLVDLGSTHGTYIGTMRLEAHKPTQLQINAQFHFGASTRNYVLRERPSAGSRSTNIMEDLPLSETTLTGIGSDGALLGLPESQTELDNLTEYNTAHNRRISMLGITEDNFKKPNSKSKRKRRRVVFNEEELVINPEDIDPAVGRFRNLIQTTVVPTKRVRVEASLPTASAADIFKNWTPQNVMLYHDLPPASASMGVSDPRNHNFDTASLSGGINGANLGIILPNPAPDVAPAMNQSLESHNKEQHNNVATVGPNIGPSQHAMGDATGNSDEPKKKKYAKEAWPGRKPLLNTF